MVQVGLDWPLIINGALICLMIFVISFQKYDLLISMIFSDDEMNFSFRFSLSFHFPLPKKHYLVLSEMILYIHFFFVIIYGYSYENSFHFPLLMDASENFFFKNAFRILEVSQRVSQTARFNFSCLICDDFWFPLDFNFWTFKLLIFDLKVDYPFWIFLIMPFMMVIYGMAIYEMLYEMAIFVTFAMFFISILDYCSLVDFFLICDPLLFSFKVISALLFWNRFDYFSHWSPLPSLSSTQTFSFSSTQSSFGTDFPHSIDQPLPFISSLSTYFHLFQSISKGFFDQALFINAGVIRNFCQSFQCHRYWRVFVFMLQFVTRAILTSLMMQDHPGNTFNQWRQLPIHVQDTLQYQVLDWSHIP